MIEKMISRYEAVNRTTENADIIIKGLSDPAEQLIAVTDLIINYAERHNMDVYRVICAISASLIQNEINCMLADDE